MIDMSCLYFAWCREHLPDLMEDQDNDEILNGNDGGNCHCTGIPLSHVGGRHGRVSQKDLSSTERNQDTGRGCGTRTGKLPHLLKSRFRRNQSRKTKLSVLSVAGNLNSSATGISIKEHNMDAKEYRKKYGFSARQPLAAKSLSAKRRATAKIHNLGEKLQEKRREKAAGKEVPETAVETKVKTGGKGRKSSRAKKDSK